MPIEPTQNIGAVRAVGALDARLVRRSAGERTSTESKPLVATSDALDPGAIPVDNERVAEVKKAVESGTYPLLPMKVADAIIAAGMLLRNPK